MLAVFSPPLGAQAASLISQEQMGFPSSVPLRVPDARSSCLSHQLGACSLTSTEPQQLVREGPSKGSIVTVRYE